MPPNPLDKVDPSAAWQRWEPSAEQPWNLQWAGHLFRRAGFGANLEQLRDAVRSGFPTTLERVLKGAPGADQRTNFLDSVGERVARKSNIYELRGWWLYAMLHTLHQLREKTTLFWHNHFVSSIAKVHRAELMFKQNRLLRQHALGKFGPFLLAVSKDPAMLVYLDSNSNVKGRPNENYAREVMELFSLGVGNYTEQDIREAARAFTGWHSDGDEFEFAAALHDDGPKSIFGKTGNWNGDDVLRFCLEKQCAASFLVRKLYRFFVGEAHDPPEMLLEPLANQFRKSEYDVALLVRTILGSRHFFSEHAYRQRIKSPVEFAVGAVLAAASPAALAEGRVAQEGLINRTDSMGQPLFAPPNVKGWPGGKNWLNTSTVLARHNFALDISSANLPIGRRPPTNRFEEIEVQVEEDSFQAENAAKAGQGKAATANKPRPAPSPALDIAAAVQREKPEKPAQLVQLLLELLLQGEIEKEARTKLEKFVADGNPEGPALAWRIRDAAHAIMTVPEYQLA
ncbi:MAG TPA: DUF1800 domain-containing protein [Gemmataceae bacterium]|nr:DUF1800 domain-containing protein [Gemmataceae bacterium]